MTDDDLTRRLRAADPAAGAAPDLDRLRAKVRARLGPDGDDQAPTRFELDGPVAPGAPGPEGAAGHRAPVVPLGVALDRRARSSRRGSGASRWAAAAAVVAVVGLGGHAVGSALRSSDDAAGSPSVADAEPRGSDTDASAERAPDPVTAPDDWCLVGTWVDDNADSTVTFPSDGTVRWSTLEAVATGRWSTSGNQLTVSVESIEHQGVEPSGGPWAVPVMTDVYLCDETTMTRGADRYTRQ